MKTFDQFSKRVLVICAGVCMILVTNAMLPSSAKAEKKTFMSGSNTIYMGIDNGYAYYMFMPESGSWSFEKISLTKAKMASW
jgi:hypothetical protein